MFCSIRTRHSLARRSKESLCRQRAFLYAGTPLRIFRSVEATMSVNRRTAQRVSDSSGRIQQRLELVDGIAELVCATEFADDFIDVAVIGDWPHFQHVGQRELEFAVGGVFLLPVAI